MEKRIKHKTADICLKTDGIIWFRFEEYAFIEMSDVHDFVSIIDELCEGKSHLFCLDLRKKHTNITNEARKFMGTDPGALKWRMADALIVNSLHMHILANAYMRFDAPIHPVRAFTEVEKAESWLLKKRAEHEAGTGRQKKTSTIAR